MLIFSISILCGCLGTKNSLNTELYQLNTNITHTKKKRSLVIRIKMDFIGVKYVDEVDLCRTIWFPKWLMRSLPWMVFIKRGYHCQQLQQQQPQLVHTFSISILSNEIWKNVLYIHFEAYFKHNFSDHCKAIISLLLVYLNKKTRRCEYGCTD